MAGLRGSFVMDDDEDPDRVEIIEAPYTLEYASILLSGGTIQRGIKSTRRCLNAEDKI